MSLTPGSRLGAYELVSLLGEGGMGQVYRARDAKLNRDVAIKILPDVFAHDRERVARFTREAQTLASLNHPNIAQIYGIVEEGPSTGSAGSPQAGSEQGSENHIHALVMELVEGDDLSVIIARGAMPFADVLPIARQLADALEAAHEQGIVHRDLKPANIKVRADGTVKVLDFGLAKALDPAGASGSGDLMHSPTMTARATQMGMIIGTAAYMSPEQARGKTVDRRADIWAFGVVLFEMLTGRRAFAGDDVSVTLAGVIKDDVPWEALPTSVPASVRRLLRRCLEKDPKRRLSAIGDARFDLDESDAPVATSGTHAATSVTASMPAPAGPRWHRLAWAFSTFLALAALVTAAYYIVATRGSAAPAGPLFVALPAEPADMLAGDVTFSPDGSELVFVGRTGTTTQLYRRSMKRPGASAIPGTEGTTGDGAAFSPDGKWLAFRANRRLKKISLDGGPATELATARASRPAWGPNDTIIANIVGNGGLSSIPANGGPPTALTKLDTAAGDVEHTGPVVLPGGQAFLYLADDSVAGDSEPMLVAQRFTGGERKRLFRASRVRWLAPGELLFLRGARAMRVGFDPRTLTLLGEAVPVPDRLLAPGGLVLLEPSSSGAIAYVSSADVEGPSGQSAATRMVKVTDGGATSPFAFPERMFSDPRVSPDGTRVAVHGFEKGFDNWVADLKRGTLMRLTFDVGEDETPVWSPDGRSIAYSSTREGLERAIYRKAADGSGKEELLWSGKGHVHLGGFTPDGKSLVVSYTAGAPYEIGSLSVETGKLTPLLSEPYGEYEPALSKDGRWLAYTSDESGRPEVYVRSFPSMEGRWQVSIDGGTEPVWARDGRTLYFRGSGKILAVAVAPGASFVPASPRAFVDDRFAGVQGDGHTGFDALPDGSLLMVQDTVERRTIRYVNLVLNWLQAPSAPAKDTP